MKGKLQHHVLLHFLVAAFLTHQYCQQPRLPWIIRE